MRFLLAFTAAQSMGLFLPSASFVPPIQQIRQMPLSRLQVGADDGDLPSGDIEGAELSDEMKQKIKKATEEDEYGGGTRFKELMEAAQKAKAEGISAEPKSLKNPFADNPFAGIEGLDPQATPVSASVNPDELTVEQQAEMFRRMMQGQQAAPSPQMMAPPAPKPPPPDRKVGRNRDADAIQNTADVYLAQLKRDSTVRGIARIRGDTEKANAVFADEKIEELKSLISENPHLAERREAEKKLLETAADDYVAYQKAMEGAPKDKRSSGISYKQRLAEMRKKRGGEITASSSPSAATEPKVEPPQMPKPSATQEAISQPEDVVQVPELKIEPKPSPPPSPLESHIAQQSVTAVTPTPPADEPQPVSAVAAPLQQSKVPPPQTIPSVNANSSPEEIRVAIRTLMGLILKHRGGPGFGAGGLKGNDISQYERLSDEIATLLKEEAMLQSTEPAVAYEAPTPAAITSPPATPATPATEGATAGLANVPSAPSADAQVDSMLKCIEGAIMMYRNSPVELREGVLMTIRGALLSAVNTCSKFMGDGGQIPASSSAGANVDSMLACVEGAILMYRNSPVELKETVLVTLRAALLSALGTCNKIIAENHADNYQQNEQVTSSMPKPTEFHDAVQVQEEEKGSVATPVVPVVPAHKPAADENTKALESIYNKLQLAAGSGKMGLREDLTSEEASDLADSIAEMRSILLDELDNGIPEVAATETAHANPTGNEVSSTGSIYQQMLAKARAEKANSS